MTDATYQQPNYTSPQGYESQRTGWTGWITFAGVMLVIGGSLNALYGLIGIVNDEWVVWTNRASLFLDISQWGWIHLIVGLIVLFAGIGVFSGKFLARMVAVIAAGISLVTNFFFIPAYPLWSLIVVTINVLVIWALIAHGKEMRDA